MPYSAPKPCTYSAVVSLSHMAAASGATSRSGAKLTRSVGHRISVVTVRPGADCVWWCCAVTPLCRQCLKVSA
jgi:hypothetical protein